MKHLILLFIPLVFSINCTTTVVNPEQGANQGVILNAQAPIEMVEPKNIVDPSKAIIIFNGFPSYYTHNKDFAFVLAARMGIRAFVIDYQGLKDHPGKFSFVGSITDAKLAVGELTRKFNLKELYLIGHSWGGFVALNVMNEYPQMAKRTLLLAPLIAVRKKEKDLNYLNRVFLVQNQLKTAPVKPFELANEYPVLKAKYGPLTFGKTLKGKIQIFHSKKDKVIPYKSSEIFAKTAGTNVAVTEFGISHFLNANRPKLLRMAQGFFEKPKPSKAVR